jgi:hypothetical protein
VAVDNTFHDLIASIVFSEYPVSEKTSEHTDGRMPLTLSTEPGRSLMHNGSKSVDWKKAYEFLGGKKE